MSRYAAMFDRLAARGEAAFGAFVMLGDPAAGDTGALLDSLVAAGADMVEVGIPFSDPVADGPVIQAAAARALGAGIRTADCFVMMHRFRARHPQVPLGILTYANIVAAQGLDRFCRAAAEAGADSLLVADVPVIEAQPFAAAARDAGVAPVLIAASNTPPARLREIARLGGGYTYVVARAGVTGADEAVRFDPVPIAALRDAGAPPPVLGFGIARPDHVRAAVAAGAAGAISGSAIVARLAAGQPAAAFVAAMKAATRPTFAAEARIG